MSAAERGRIVWKLGDLIMQNLDEMARLESLNTGQDALRFGQGRDPIRRGGFSLLRGAGPQDPR